MNKIIALLVVGSFLFLQGCILSTGKLRYETSNTVILEVKNKPEKQTFKLFISARDKTQFEQIVSNIANILAEWNR